MAAASWAAATAVVTAEEQDILGDSDSDEGRGISVGLACGRRVGFGQQRDRGWIDSDSCASRIRTVAQR